MKRNHISKITAVMLLYPALDQHLRCACFCELGTVLLGGR